MTLRGEIAAFFVVRALVLLAVALLSLAGCDGDPLERDRGAEAITCGAVIVAGLILAVAMTSRRREPDDREGP